MFLVNAANYGLMVFIIDSWGIWGRMNQFVIYSSNRSFPITRNIKVTAWQGERLDGSGSVVRGGGGCNKGTRSVPHRHLLTGGNREPVQSRRREALAITFTLQRGGGGGGMAHDSVAANILEQCYIPVASTLYMTQGDRFQSSTFWIK